MTAIAGSINLRFRWMRLGLDREVFQLNLAELA